MPSIDPAALSGRYLSFAEREEIAILKAQGVGVREIARRAGTVAVDDLAGAASQRGDAVAAGSSTGRRSRSGRRSWWRGGPRRPSSSPIERLREYVQDAAVG